MSRWQGKTNQIHVHRLFENMPQVHEKSRTDFQKLTEFSTALFQCFIGVIIKQSALYLSR